MKRRFSRMRSAMARASALSILALSGCGGADGGTGSVGSEAIGITIPTPTPTPAVAPTPTPTPMPTPTVSNPRYTPIAAAKPTTGIALPIGKCVNVPGLESKSLTFMGNATAATFTYIKNGGFKTVRIPVRFQQHASTSAPYTIDASWMRRVREYSDMANAAGLNVIVDLHAFDELADDPAGNADRFVSFWRQIGAAFASAPDNVYFELLNEPVGAFKSSVALPIYTRAIAEIRKGNPKRPVIVGPWYLDQIVGLQWMVLPDDPYIVPTVHYYDPSPFTTQGATWTTTVYPIGVTWGSADDYAKLEANIEELRAWMAKTGRVPFVGEYGAIEFAQPEDRVKYYSAVSSAFASIGVDSCAWGYDNDYPLRDANGWIQPLVSQISQTKGS